ncbi:sodium:alanine symporter [Alishewanella longhuensis]
MQELVNTINSYVWSDALIYLCLGAGLFYSILTRFAQVRHFKEMCKLLLNNSSSDKGIRRFRLWRVLIRSGGRR